MRPYQLAPIPTILHSISNHLGWTIILILPRQSGKDELLVWLKVFLLRLFSHLPVGIVEFNPTYKPQTINALDRFETALKQHILTRKRWRKRGDFMRALGLAKCSFLSGEPTANVVGSTASLALFINEAQDIAPADFDRKQDPMTASTNATKVIAGTVWTSRTLLAREMRAALQAEEQDGNRRVFIYDANDVRKIVPWYGAHVDEKIRKLGRQHPLVKTQYFNEEIDAQAGMFHAGRRALMLGDQPAHETPIPGHIYAMTIDVGGQDEAMLELDGMSNPGRDYTTLNIVDVDLSTLQTLQAPTYRVVKRFSWQGESHPIIYGKILSLVDAWTPMFIAIDSTGVGEGLWGMLARTYPTKIIPFKFTGQSKSELGYGYIAIIETGRFRDCEFTPEIDMQYANCESEILIGPAHTMRWGVPNNTRNPATGELVHDDHIIADALIAVLDRLQWYANSPTQIAEAQDPLKNMDRNF